MLTGYSLILKLRNVILHVWVSESHVSPSCSGGSLHNMTVAVSSLFRHSLGPLFNSIVRRKWLGPKLPK